MPIKSNPSFRSSANDRAMLEIRRLWGDVPVIDAEKEIRIFINQDDVKKAIRKDESSCVFAQACKRLFGASKVLFFRSVAYVELPNEDGKKHVERFQMSDAMRQIVEGFDRGQGVIPEGGFVLRPPKPSKRLDRELARTQRRDKRKKLRNKLEGTRESDGIGRGKGAYRDEPIAIDLAIRDGRGAVHFAHIQPKAK